MEKNKNIFDQVKNRKTSQPDAQYFEAMADSILNEQTIKVIPFYKKPVVWISSVAAAALILLTIQLTSTETVSQQQFAITDVSNEEIYKYMDENIDDFELDEIAEIMPLESIAIYTTTGPAEVDTEISFENISKEEIIEYLLDEGIDLDEWDESNEYFI